MQIPDAMDIPNIDSSNEREYIFDSSEIEEYETMIENMKKELLCCKLKLNYLEKLVLVMLENNNYKF